MGSNMKQRNIHLNLILTILILVSAFAWMITGASRGEIIDYSRHAVITAVDIDVELYELINEEYVLVTAEKLNLTNMAPGDKRQFRFDVTNNNNNISTSKIVFSDIVGDIELLKNKIFIGSSNPRIFEYSLAEKLELTTNNKYIFRFNDNFEVEAKTKVSLYWYISLDSKASNEIANKTLTIDNISFIRP